jgi:hypothetical protein
MVVGIVNRGEHLTVRGLREILSVRASMNKGLTEVLKESFPEISPVPRPTVSNQEIKDPQ